MEQERTLAKAGQRRNRAMGPLVGQFGVNLVGHHQEIVSAGQFGNSFEIRRFESRAGGIIREVQDERLGPRADLCGDRVGREAKILFVPSVEHDRASVCQLDDRTVRNVARFVIEHFITGIECGTKGQIHGFTHTRGYEDLVGRRILDTEELRDVFGDPPAKLGQSQVGSVCGGPLFQCVHGSIANVPGCRKAGFAHSKTDRVGDVVDDIEEIADSGFRDTPDDSGNEVRG